MVGVVEPTAGGETDHDDAPGLHLRLFGSLAATREGIPLDLGSPKQRAVLAVLALEAGRVVPTDRILDLLWDDPDQRAVATLQTYVSNLRRILEPDRRPREPATILVTDPPGYRLALAAPQVDALQMVELVNVARRRHQQGDVQGALARLERALSLWTGLLLPELAGEPFVVEARGRLDRIHLAAVALAAEIRLAGGDHLGALAVAEPALDENPLDEHLHALTALALYRGGRQADALRVINRARTALADQAGLDAGPELRELEADLLAHAPSLAWEPPAGRVGRVAAALARSHPESVATGPTAGGRPHAGLVGRDTELGRLSQTLERAITGTGTAVVVIGEPGIGKTRLLEELAERARERGVAVAWARCPESGAIPPFWPVTEISRQLFDEGAVGATLAPPLAPIGASDAPSPQTLFELYGLVVDAMRTASRPMLAVVDDLQWADADSLRLLGHVAAELPGSPLLVCVASRPLDDQSPPGLLDGLDALARVSGSVDLRLEGLSADAVDEWLHSRSDDDLPRHVAELIHERTSGHPLFVKELSELLLAEGRLTEAGLVEARRAIPPGVQFVVRRRVTRLPQPTQQLLTVAAVVGRTFELDVVAPLGDLTVDEALDVLDPAVAAGLVVADPLGSFRFSHALVAEALEAEVNPARKARLHARAAELLDGRPDIGPEVVAHHALAGLAAGSADLAFSASVAAARSAEVRLGFEDAATHWQNAVAALGRSPAADRSTRAEALCQLSTSLFRIDRVTEASTAAVQALELAEVDGDLDARVRAAALVGHPHVWPPHAYGEVDPRVSAALRRTAAVLGEDRIADRARVLGALALDITYGPDDEWRRVAAEAREAARQSGNPEVLARVLLNTSGDMAPSEIDRRRADSLEVIDLVDEHHLHPEMELIGRFNLALTMNEVGQIDEAGAQVLRCQQLADRLGGTGAKAQLAWFQAQLELARCNYETAMALGREADELYRRTRNHDVELISLVLQVSLVADQGGFAAFIDRFADAVEQSPAYGPSAALIMGWLASENGWPDLARDLVSSITPLGELPDDYMTVGTGCAALQLFCDLGSVDEVARLIPQLEPYAGRWAALGSGPAVLGLVELSLARGAECLGRLDEARERYAAAAAGHDEMRTPAWLARSLIHQARFLFTHGEAADRIAAGEALDRAVALARHHDLVPLLRQAESVPDLR